MTAKNRHRIAQTAAMAAIAAMLLALGSCIKPPLNLAAESVVIDLPIVDTELEVVWNINTDLEKDWYYGWDDTDKALCPAEHTPPTDTTPSQSSATVSAAPTTSDTTTCSCGATSTPPTAPRCSW